MRVIARIMAYAALASAGCASMSTAVDPSASTRQWRELRDRLTPDEPAPLRACACAPELTDQEQALLEEVARQASASVVRVRTARLSPPTKRSPGTTTVATASDGGGTGVVIASDGVILTNEHVIRGARCVSVVLPGGREVAVERTFVHPTSDLAVLWVDAVGLVPITLAPGLVQIETPVVAIAAEGLDVDSVWRTGRVTAGTVSLQRELDPGRARDYQRLIESTARPACGYSGGPLLDLQGRFVGLSVASSGHCEGEPPRGYAVPLDATVLPFVSRYAERKEARARLVSKRDR